VSGSTPATHLGDLLADLPQSPNDVVVVSDDARVTLRDLQNRIAELADVLSRAGVMAGQPVGSVVDPGPAAIVAMFAIWSVGAVCVPINRRSTSSELRALFKETPIALVVGAPGDLGSVGVGIGAVAHDYTGRTAQLVRVADAGAHRYDADIALVLRTSGTTGSPKAVLLRHAGTLAAIDASLAKLRRGKPSAAQPGTRMNLIPVSLALWAGIFNTLFSLRAGFGVVLLDRFTPAAFARAVREYGITSTVLAPAMITMLTDSEDLDDLSPLRLVRSITAPLSPTVARQFHARFGAFVLNSYGQTELGGEVVGWTIEDVRQHGTGKLGSVGRPYEDVELHIRRPDGSEAEVDEFGEIYVRSPFRMGGYAPASGELRDEDDERYVDGYLRTGDIGRIDTDGFLWVEGRVSDMINRGGLKVFPDEVEEVLRRHPRVRDAAVAAIPDSRLGEVPSAWVVCDDAVPDSELTSGLTAWCREHLAPYKVPVAFLRVQQLPRSEIGKLLRRQLTHQVTRSGE
jgi:acyl-CoA synthetase (AMP-forming)/AMP-acid ligase II